MGGNYKKELRHTQRGLKMERAPLSTESTDCCESITSVCGYLGRGPGRKKEVSVTRVTCKVLLFGAGVAKEGFVTPAGAKETALCCT